MTRKEEIDRLNQEIDAALGKRTPAAGRPDTGHSNLPNRLARTDFARRSRARDALRRQLLAHHPVNTQRRTFMNRFTPILRAAPFGAMLVLIVYTLGWLLSNAGLMPEPAASPSTGQDELTEAPLSLPNVSGPPPFEPLPEPLTFEWVSGPKSDFFYASIASPGAVLGQIEFGSLQGGWCDRSANGGVVAFAHSQLSGAGSPGFSATLRWASLHDLANIQDPFPEMKIWSPPTFSPAGFRLAFSACPADGNCGLFVYDLETGNLDRISPYQPVQPVLWSPDGKEIAFKAPSGDLTELHVISAMTGATTFLGDLIDSASALSSWGRPLPEGVSGVERCEAAPGIEAPMRLSMESGSEEIRLRLLYSHTFWQSLWADAELTDISGAVTSSQRTQIWLEQPARARVLSGAPGATPALLWISDGERTRTGEEVRIEPFNPPAGESNGAYPHPLTGILPTPLSSLLFPSGLAQRDGTYVPVEIDAIAGREALVVDWQAPWGAIVDRFWVDTATGVILRQINSGKDGGGSITSDYRVNAITFGPGQQPVTFNTSAPFPPSFAAGPEDIYTEVPASTPAGTPETSLDDGTVYLLLDSSAGWGTAGLVRLPAACLVTGAACPRPEFVEGRPEGFAYSAQYWSPDYSQLVYELSGPEDQVWIYNPAENSWGMLNSPYFSGSVWSPDGTQLAGQPVLRGDAVSNPIVIAKADGSGWQELLAEAPGFKSPFSWEDDHTLLYVNTLDNQISDTDSTVYSEIQRVDLQTGEVEVLAGIRSDANTSQFGVPALSPDRTRFVYTISSWQAGTAEVVIYDLPARTERSFILEKPGGVSWAPDGERLLVTAALGYTCALGLVEPDGTGYSELYVGDSGGGCQSTWSPDGRYLLVSESTRDPTVPRLTIVDVETGDTRTVTLPAVGIAFDRPRAAWLP